MIDLKKSYNKICLLGVTAMPGGQRLILLVVVEYLFGMKTLGIFVNDISIVFLFAFMSAVGSSNLVLIRTTSMDDSEGYREILRIFLLSISLVFVFSFVIYFLYILKLVFSPGMTVLLLFSWTGYQIFRHYMIAKKYYIKLFNLEIVLLVSTLLILSLTSKIIDYGPYLSMIIPYAGFSIVFVFLFLKKLDLKRIYGLFSLEWIKVSLVKSSEFGLANFVSGGMGMLLPPIIIKLSSPEYGALMGLIINFLGIAVLFPRALALNNLPDLSRAFKLGNFSVMENIVVNFRKKILFLNILIILFSIFFGKLSFDVFYKKEFSLPGAFLIFIILLFNAIISHVFYPDINYFMAKEESRFLLVTNSLTFLFFLALIMCSFLIEFSQFSGIIYILSIYLISTSLRNLFIYYRRRQDSFLMRSSEGNA